MLLFEGIRSKGAQVTFPGKISQVHVGHAKACKIIVVVVGNEYKCNPTLCCSLS